MMSNLWHPLNNEGKRNKNKVVMWRKEKKKEREREQLVNAWGGKNAS